MESCDKAPLVSPFSVELHIDGMTCVGCANSIKESLCKKEGIEQVLVSVETDSALVSFDEKKIAIEGIIALINSVGFKAQIPGTGRGDNPHALLVKTTFCLIVGIVQIVFCMFFMHSGFYSHKIATGVSRGALIELCLSSIILIVAGREIILKGASSLLLGSPGMDFLIAIGISISYTFSLLSLILSLIRGIESSVFFETATTLTSTAYLGKFLEMKAKERCSEYLRKLETVFPKQAIKEENGKLETVLLKNVHKGDRVKVNAGDRIPVDGICLGQSLVDESLISGESFPIGKNAGDHVFAGSIALDEVSIVSTGPPDNTLVHQIAKSMKMGQEKKPKIQAIADVLAAKFVVSILCLGCFTFFFWIILGASGMAPKLFYQLDDSIIFSSLKMAITVITIACPCALGLAAPMAVVVGKGSAAKKGIIVTNSQVIDNAENIDMIVFDKTGTLTIGKPEVLECILLDENVISKGDIMNLCHALEHKSSHILGKAIVKFCEVQSKGAEVTNIRHSNQGVYGQWNQREISVGSQTYTKELGISIDQEKIYKFGSLGRTIVYFAIDKQLLALFIIGDRLRGDINDVVGTFKSQGYRICILSGDQWEATKAISEQANIREFYANKSPFDKAEFIAVQQEHGNRVCFVGDGINDSPALGRANVSIAVGMATDLTAASADIVLLKPSLKNVYEAIRICKLMRRKIMMNFVCAVAYNLIAIPIAFGALLPIGIYISPTYSGAFMALSSLCVVLNSVMLKREIN